MKKNLITGQKGATLKFVLIISSLFLALPIKLLAECTDPDGCVYSTGEQGKTLTPKFEYQYGFNGHSYGEFGPTEPGARITITSQTTGNTQTVNIFGTQAEVNAASEKGLCPNSSCKTAAEMGLSGTSREGWTQQIANAGKKEGANGISFDYSDPYSLAKAKTVLEMDGIDTSNMSMQDIASKATEIAKTTGGFSKSEMEYQTVIIRAVDGSVLYSTDCGNECGAIAADGYAVHAISDMKQGTAKTDDGGAVCSEKECPQDPKDPPKRPSTPSKFEVNPESCAPSMPEIPSVELLPEPEGYFYGGECGTKAVDVSYSLSSVACGYATMLTTVTTTAQLPSVQNTVYAGKGFNWEPVSSSKTNVSTTLYDDGPLQREFLVTKTRISSIEGAIGCLNKQINELTREYNTAYASCTATLSDLEDDLSDCENDTCYETVSIPCENPNQTGCTDEEETSCDCSSEEAAVSSQQETCDALTAAYEKALASLEKEIENYEKDLAIEQAREKELEGCQASIPHGGSSTSYDTVSITNEKMVLNDKYTQLIDTIRGISKNSGNPLTLNQIENVETGTYLTINTDFFVPYNIPKNTKGYVIGNIVGDINIPNYKCPIETDNYILCRGDKCDSGLEIIYRPISLTNPFPNTTGDSKYRQMGSNWNQMFAERYIEKNRNVSDYDIYRMKPLYTFTLTPSTIKEIRKYNKQHSYGDFNMKCVTGYRCMSQFLWDSSFTKIIDQGNSCATSNGWNSECYYGGVSE